MIRYDRQSLLVQFCVKKHKNSEFLWSWKRKWTAPENLCFFDKYWNKFFDSKSWITILNMKLKLEQIETLEIRSERKTQKKKRKKKSRLKVNVRCIVKYPWRFESFLQNILANNSRCRRWQRKLRKNQKVIQLNKHYINVSMYQCKYS